MKMIKLTRLEAEHLKEVLVSLRDYPDDDMTNEIEDACEIIEAVIHRDDLDFEQEVLDDIEALSNTGRTSNS